MKAPAIFSYASTTLQTIVSAINDGGTAMNSAEEIAGYYAFDAATEAAAGEWTVTDDEIGAQLEALAGLGAEFDYSKAMAVAKKYQANK